MYRVNIHIQGIAYRSMQLKSKRLRDLQCSAIETDWQKLTSVISSNYSKNIWKKELTSLHTPRSKIAWECCIQRMAIPSISDGQSDRKLVSSELYKIILAKVQKGYKLLLKKDQISISCKNAYLQITGYVLHNYKVSQNPVERFQRSWADKLFQ